MLATTWLVETFGQRRTFLATMAVFFVGSILGAASWSAESMIAARVLQGAAAGVMQPLSMIALFEVFPPEERGRAMGLCPARHLYHGGGKADANYIPNHRGNPSLFEDNDVEI